MMKTYFLSDIMDIIGGGTPKTSIAEYWSGDIPWLSVKDFNTDDKYVKKTEKCISKLGLENSSTVLLQTGDLIISARGTVGELAMLAHPMAFNQSCYGLRAKSGIVTNDFLYYLLKHNLRILKNNSHGSVFDTITRDTFDNIQVSLPSITTQNKISVILSALDDKIELNQRENNNLEQQAQALFNEMFLEDMVSVHSKHHLPLSELVQNIDNRGKTPPLSPKKTDFPIIDVKALSGNTRIINYDNCTKFVSQETYLTGFRNGLPQKYDILLSTVGSLGEMKLFIEPKGCIAQNVIGYRSKISPLYLYQYLKTIKNDLLAYDIGSVQPSIKVTHIAKHPIFVPDKNKLKEFHGIAEAITNKIYINSQENTRLAQLRDTLLPKLMSGEIDVSKVDINELNAADMLL